MTVLKTPHDHQFDAFVRVFTNPAFVGWLGTNSPCHVVNVTAGLISSAADDQSGADLWLDGHSTGCDRPDRHRPPRPRRRGRRIPPEPLTRPGPPRLPRGGPPTPPRPPETR